VKSLIYGYGITGQSVEKYLIKNNIEYLIYDDNKIVYTSDLFTDNLKQEWDVIYCSPGVSRETFKNLKKIFLLNIYLILLSILLEILHIIIPNRSFELSDLFGNLIGVTIVIIINFFLKNEKNKS